MYIHLYAFTPRFEKCQHLLARNSVQQDAELNSLDKILMVAITNHRYKPLEPWELVEVSHGIHV